MLTTRDVTFSASELEAIDWGWFHADSPIVRRRMAVLRFRSLGKTITEIAELVGCAENTVRSALDLFAQGGLSAVETVEVPAPSSALEPFREQLRQEFSARPARSVNEARKTIAKLTGVELKNEAIRVFMHSLGMEYRKVGAVPSKADPDRQEEFKKKSWSLDSNRPDKASGGSSS